MRVHIRDFHKKCWEEVEKTEFALTQKFRLLVDTCTYLSLSQALIFHFRDLVSSETFRPVVYSQKFIGKAATPCRDAMLDITPDYIGNNEAKIRLRLEAFIERDRPVLSQKV